jgi:hypothetical protein
VAMLLSEYIDWYNQERIKENLQGLSPVQYRTQSLQVAYEQHYLALQTYWVQFISGPFDLRPLHGDILVLCVGLARIARCGSFRCLCVFRFGWGELPLQVSGPRPRSQSDNLYILAANLHRRSPAYRWPGGVKRKQAIVVVLFSDRMEP